MKVEDDVILKTPTNPHLHGREGRIKARFGDVFLVATPAAATGEFRALADELEPKGGPAPRATAPSPIVRAKEQGFTGNCCPKCLSTRMVMGGKCDYCLDCGEQAGCS